MIDQYQISTDSRSSIINDPNRDDEPDYIVKLIGRVITVSLETQKLIARLPALERATGSKVRASLALVVNSGKPVASDKSNNIP